MSKLNKYNQILLAIVGTLGVIFLLIIIWVSSKEIRRDLFRDSYNAPQSEGVIVENKTNEENQKLRGQIISLGKPDLLDSTNAMYLIPVETIDLNDPEVVEVYQSRKISYSGTFHHSKSYSYKKGSVNNLIIKQLSDFEGHLVFNFKAHIKTYSFHAVYDQYYLLIIANSQDTNSDNKLSDKDLSSFFVYDISTKKLSAFSFENHHLEKFTLLYPSNDILLTYVYDRNKDGEFDLTEEPTVLKTLSLDDEQLKDYVDAQMMRQLQDIIDQ